MSDDPRYARLRAAGLSHDKAVQAIVDIDADASLAAFDLNELTDQRLLALVSIAAMSSVNPAIADRLFDRDPAAVHTCTRCGLGERDHVWTCMGCLREARPGTCGCGKCFMPDNVPCGDARTDRCGTMRLICPKPS